MSTDKKEKDQLNDDAKKELKTDVENSDRQESIESLDESSPEIEDEEKNQNIEITEVESSEDLPQDAGENADKSDNIDESSKTKPDIEGKESVHIESVKTEEEASEQVEAGKNTIIEEEKISDTTKASKEEDEELSNKEKESESSTNTESTEDVTSESETGESTDEKKGESEKTTKEEFKLDYSNYTKKQLVQVLESLLKEDDFSQVGRILKGIKKPYDDITDLERKTAYDNYIADGGEKDGFEYRPDELDQRFQKAFGELRGRRNQYFNSLEKQKETNLNKKQELLERMRELVDSEETGASIKVLKEIQKEWKEIGLIPSSQVKSLWANFNALLDRFYDQRSIYFELKELDRKKNYDQKIELCEKAEHLVEEENIREAIKQLNELHEEFKHIGPVPKVDQDAVWERFKTASDNIYSRRKDYYDKLKEEFKINEIAKEGLVEKVLTFAEYTSDRISDWNTKTKEIIAIQKEWEAIGSLPKEKAKSINKQFWVSFKAFFNNKGRFFKKIEEGRKENLKLKETLVKTAEELKDSDDFRKTSDELKNLQRKWKDIGPVPEKFRNEIFNRFKKACDHFFERRRANSGLIEKEYEDNLKRKEQLCEELEALSKVEEIGIAKIKAIESKWKDIGFVPKTSIKSIQKRYTEAIESITDNLDMPESEKHKLRFTAQFSKMNYGPGAEKLIQKKEGALRRQISNLENDINLWKNNIDFFAASKNADKLKKEFQVKIDNAINQLKNLKEQLKVIINI